MRLLFYVQHLLGIGHLHRAARIAKALSRDGFEVRLVLGGPPTPGLDIGSAEIVQLPPVMAGPEGFSRLVHADGRAFTAADAERRTQLLLAAFDGFTPDILLIEAFPFGRRQMRFELIPLLERAKARPTPPRIAASVRDILQQVRRPERVRETVDLVERFFDVVLVHGDPMLTTLAASFPAADLFGTKVAYTGLVAPERPDSPSGEHYGVVVSVGGGAVGAQLLRTALAARPLTAIADRPWLVLTGLNMPAETEDVLASARRVPGLRIEPFVSDLVGILGRTDVSVSQAGYNTVADVLAAGCRAVLVPFAQGGETEQSDRARLLSQRGLATVLPEAGLTAAGLAAAIDAAYRRRQPAHMLDLDGARATGRLLQARFRAQQAG